MGTLSPRGSEAPKVNIYMCICQLGSKCLQLGFESDACIANKTL